MPGAKAGVISTDIFLNGTMGAPYVAADGNWCATASAHVLTLALPACLRPFVTDPQYTLVVKAEWQLMMCSPVLWEYEGMTYGDLH